MFKSGACFLTGWQDFQQGNIWKDVKTENNLGGKLNESWIHNDWLSNYRSSLILQMLQTSSRKKLHLAWELLKRLLIP